MSNDFGQNHRRSIRLSGYDYSQEGAYFVTLCSHQRETIFEDGRFRRIVEKYWFDLTRHHPQVELDEFVVMPNHIHGVIVLVGAGSDDRTGNSVRSDKPALFQHSTSVDSKSAHSPSRRAGLPVLRPGEPAPTNTNQGTGRHSFQK